MVVPEPFCAQYQLTIETGAKTNKWNMPRPLGLRRSRHATLTWEVIFSLFDSNRCDGKMQLLKFYAWARPQTCSWPVKRNACPTSPCVNFRLPIRHQSVCLPLPVELNDRGLKFCNLCLKLLDHWGNLHLSESLVNVLWAVHVPCLDLKKVSSLDFAWDGIPNARTRSRQYPGSTKGIQRKDLWRRWCRRETQHETNHVKLAYQSVRYRMISFCAMIL